MRKRLFRQTIISAILIFTLVFQSNYSSAQACGNGEFDLELYSLNGVEIEDVSYEIYAINSDSLESIYGSVWVRGFNWQIGKVISSQYAVRLRDTTTKLYTNELDKMLGLTESQSTGDFTNGAVKFRTYETHSTLYLLKLHSDVKEVWVIVAVLGGCDRTAFVLWNDRPQIIGRE